DGLKSALSVEENLEFWSCYLAQEPDRRSRTVGAALGVVGLSHVAGAPFGVLSAGQKRRAALARLLVAFRPLWLLDEPLTALDRASRERFAVAMRDHCGHGGLIIAATHEPLGLDEAASLALGAAS
ncbi:MAG: ATP-binding cassette domain-containing protein, partial [Methylocystis sp.]